METCTNQHSDKKQMKPKIRGFRRFRKNSEIQKGTQQQQLQQTNIELNEKPIISSEQQKVKQEEPFQNQKYKPVQNIKQVIQINNLYDQKHKMERIPVQREEQADQNAIIKEKKLKPHEMEFTTTHVPTNMMNNLIPYLLQFYEEHKILCVVKQQQLKLKQQQQQHQQQLQNQQIDQNLKIEENQSGAATPPVKEINIYDNQNKCHCKNCESYRVLKNMKQSRRNKSIQDFRKIWVNDHMRIISENFFVRCCPYAILSKPIQKNTNLKHRKSAYRLSHAFLYGARAPDCFYRLM